MLDVRIENMPRSSSFTLYSCQGALDVAEILTKNARITRQIHMVCQVKQKDKMIQIKESLSAYTFRTFFCVLPGWLLIAGLVGFMANVDLWGLIFTHKSEWGFMGIYNILRLPINPH